MINSEAKFHHNSTGRYLISKIISFCELCAHLTHTDTLHFHLGPKMGRSHKLPVHPHIFFFCFVFGKLAVQRQAAQGEMNEFVCLER